MPSFFSSLRFRLTLLVFLTMLPLLILTIYLGLQEQSLARTAAEDKLRSLTDLAAEDQDTLINSAFQLLNILALSPQIRQAAPICQAYLVQVDLKMESFSGLEVFGSGGDLLCSSVDFSRPVNEAGQAYFQQALNSGSFSLGRYQAGPAANPAVLKFALPVPAAVGGQELVLAAALDLNWLGDSIRAISLPADTSLFILDQDGILLAGTTQAVGRLFSEPALQEAIRAGQERGLVQSPAPDGSQHILSYQPLVGEGGGRIYVAVSTPLERAHAAINLRLAFGVLSLVGVALLTALAAWCLGERLLLQRTRLVLNSAQRLTGRIQPGSG